MSKPDFKLCKSKADALLKKYSYFMPPIDPEKIAEAEGIDVVYAEFEAPANDMVSGYFDLEKNRIVINKDISDNRITFTIAHELAHHQMHQDYIRSNDYIPMPRSNSHLGEKPKEEIEADQFAANLLVPLSMLKKYQKVGSVSELASLFFVSEDVIRNRLSLLSRYPSLAK